MLTEKELLDAVIEETGLPVPQAQEMVHSIIDLVAHEFEVGEPVVNIETGTVDVLIDKDSLFVSLVDKANLTASEAQPAFEAILELLTRL